MAENMTDAALAHTPKAATRAPEGWALDWDRTPDLGASTPEPSLRQVLRTYYASHFDAERSEASVERYIDAYSAAAAPAAPAGEPDAAVPDAVKAMLADAKAARLSAAMNGSWQGGLIADTKIEIINAVVAAYAHPQPASPELGARLADPLFGVCDFSPDLGAATAEPTIRDVMRSYFGCHFDAPEALRLTDAYCIAINVHHRILAGHLVVPTPSPDSEPRPADVPVELAAPDELTQREIKSRAAALVKNFGWEPGDSLHFQAALTLMTNLGMDVLLNPPKDRCAYPGCGCDHDARCGVSFSTSSVAQPAAPSHPAHRGAEEALRYETDARGAWVWIVWALSEKAAQVAALCSTEEEAEKLRSAVPQIYPEAWFFAERAPVNHSFGASDLRALHCRSARSGAKRHRSLPSATADQTEGRS